MFNSIPLSPFNVRM
jgi:hypothetical protein